MVNASAKDLHNYMVEPWFSWAGVISVKHRFWAEQFKARENVPPFEIRYLKGPMAMQKSDCSAVFHLP